MTTPTPQWRKYTAGTMPEVSEIRWLWDQRLPRGHLAFIGGHGGVGKSVLVWGLAFSVTQGRPFLGGETDRGPVIVYDFDSDPEPQGYMMAKVRRGLQIAPADVDGLIHYRSPDPPGQPMSAERLEQVKVEIREIRPALVVIDAWTSALYSVRSNDTEQVASAMAALRALTAAYDDQTPGPCVLIIDHAPKPMQKGPTAVERGIIGSTMKLATARAGYLLTRVPPRDVEGRDVLALHTLKSNLGPIHEPLGVERVWNQDAVLLRAADLPEAETGAPLRRKAQVAIREALDSVEWIARKALIRSVVNRASVQERTVLHALSDLIGEKVVIVRTDPDDSRRRQYRLADVIGDPND